MIQIKGKSTSKISETIKILVNIIHTPSKFHQNKVVKGYYSSEGLASYPLWAWLEKSPKRNHIKIMSINGV